MSTNTRLVPLDVIVPAEIKAQLERLVAETRADGGNLTLDVLVVEALQDWLAETALAAGLAEKTHGFAGDTMSFEHASGAIDDDQAHAEAALQAALRETPEEAAAAADDLRALFAQWQAEADAHPEQAAAEWEAFKESMNANRAATGEEPLYV